MNRLKYSDEIRNRIESFGKGSVFVASDFLDIASTDAINKALSRLHEEGKIRRVMQGVYDYPQFSELLGEHVVINPEKVADTLAKKFNWTIAPSGNTALNLLHLSTQVPNVWSYVSDGPNREYQFDNVKITFRKCANRETSGRSYITVLIIQALKTLGKNRVTEKDISILKTVLSDKDKVIILQESKTAAAWIYELVKQISIERRADE